MNTLQVAPSLSLSGIFEMPGDKSITHRAMIIGAISNKTLTLKGWLNSFDCLATLNALQLLGIEVNDGKHLSINGRGLYGLKAPCDVLDLGNSGTGLRLLAGVLVGQNFDSVLTGDESLCNRPMQRIIEPLRMMGARIIGKNHQAPLYICGSKQLISISYKLPVASAQVKSCLLLAAMYATGKTQIVGADGARDHTEVLLDYLKHNKSNLDEIDIPGDISSAAFFIVAACIVPGSKLIIRNVGINPTRTGLLHLLLSMGANISIFDSKVVCGEKRASIKVEYSKLTAIEVAAEVIPTCIDELPIFCIAASCAKGNSKILGARELKFKETDRIAVMAVGLTNLGIKVEVLPDGMIIHGGKLTGGEVDAHGDHRIAMAFAIAGSVAKDSIVIKNSANIATSFPNFVSLAQECGIDIS